MGISTRVLRLLVIALAPAVVAFAPACAVHRWLHHHHQHPLSTSAGSSQLYSRRHPLSTSASSSQLYSRRHPPLVLTAEKQYFGVPADVAAPLSLLLFGQLVLFIGVGAIIPTLPLYTKEIGLSSAYSGVLISAPAVMLLLLARSAGGFADSRGRKPAMIAGLLLVSISDVGTAAASSLTPLIFARLGLGAGRALSESGERAMLADLTNRAPGLRGRALGAQQAAAALGIAIGAPLGGTIAEAYGVRWTFVCVSVAAALTALIYTTLAETLPLQG